MTYRRKVNCGVHMLRRRRYRVGSGVIRVQVVHQRQRGLVLTPRNQPKVHVAWTMADSKDQLREVITNLLEVTDQSVSAVVDMCLEALFECRSRTDPSYRLHDVDSYQFTIWRNEDGGLQMGRRL